jgi:hypothetical protein
MSILIEGIDLPKEGKVHRIVVFPNGKIALDFKTYIEKYEAIQIPKGHGENVKRGWIPVSELLPKEGRPVLVSVKIKARLPKWVEKPTYYYVTDIDVYDEDYGWRENGKTVVAWQPLPEPYKGE